jgi:hypothetical protein
MTEVLSVAEYSRLRRKAPKYGNQNTYIDGIRFVSKREGARYRELKLLEQAKQISNLTLQPRFDLRVAGLLICIYVADFQYFEKGKLVVEDTKGFRTREYVIKRKLMKAIRGIEVLET